MANVGAFFQHEGNSSPGDDLEGKEVDTISADTDVFSYDSLTGEDKRWNSISTAPAEQDLEVRLEDSIRSVCALISV